MELAGQYSLSQGTISDEGNIKLFSSGQHAVLLQATICQVELYLIRCERQTMFSQSRIARRIFFAEKLLTPT